MIKFVMYSYMAEIVSYFSEGLSTVWSKLLSNWIAPVFLAAVAVFSIVFIKDRAWTKLIAFVGIAAVVGMLVFAGSDLFGSGKSTGHLSGVAKKGAKDISTIVAPSNIDTLHLKSIPTITPYHVS